jgi:hypothetical protein
MSSAVVHTAEEAGRRPWDFVIGLGFLAALRAPAPTGVLRALADLSTHAGPSAESIVGVIPVDAVESFAVVTWAGGLRAGAEVKATAIVRGDAVIDVASVGGSRRFSDGGIRPWNLADFGAVTGVTMTGRDAPLADAAVPLRRMPTPTGTVRATRLDWRSSEPAESESEQAMPAEDTVLRPRRHATVEDTRIRARPVDPAAAIATADADTILHVRTVSDAPGRRPGAGARHRQSTGSSAPPLAARPVTEQPSPVEAGTSSIAIRIGDEDPIPLARPVVIGRRPSTPRILAGAQPRLVAVPSPTRAVSSTHLEIRMEGSVIVVTDLRSTNGSLVLLESGAPRRLRPGESIVVTGGTRIDIGDGTIVEIIAADDDVPSVDQDRKRPE